VGAPGEDEPGRGRAEHELEHLAPLPAHLKAPALLVHGHRAGLEATAEVGDARRVADAGDGARWTEHESMLRARRTPTTSTGTLPSMRRTKIVATIGPASREPETLLRWSRRGWTSRG
jgi:hypothetical protein